MSSLQIQVRNHDGYGWPQEVEPTGRPRIGDEVRAGRILSLITEAACKAGERAKPCKCTTAPSITVSGSDGTTYTMQFGTGLTGWILFGITFGAVLVHEAWRIHSGRTPTPETVMANPNNAEPTAPSSGTSAEQVETRQNSNNSSSNNRSSANGRDAVIEMEEATGPVAYPYSSGYEGYGYGAPPPLYSPLWSAHPYKEVSERTPEQETALAWSIQP